MSEQNELFQSDKEFSKLVKKARRKSLLRNILISISVTIILFGGLLWMGTYRMYKKAEETHAYDYRWQFVKGANVENDGSITTNTPFSTIVTTARNKKIDGVIVPWGEHVKVYSVFGSSSAVQASANLGSGTREDGRNPLYFLGERVMEFYYPTGTYPVLPDDRALLDDIQEHQVVEMAFSFDQAYSINEVRETFSDQLAWYWVNAASLLEKDGAEQPVSGEDAYGFISRTEEMNEDAAERFLKQVEWLQREGASQQEAQRLYDVLSDSGKIKPAPENLRITGAVVTGTPKELKKFAEEPIVRAAVLGATADKY